MRMWLVTETVEAATVAVVQAASPASPAAAAASEPDRLFTLTPSSWLELDKECATFLHTALRCGSGNQCKPVVIGNIEQMESAVKSIKVSIAELSLSASSLFSPTTDGLIRRLLSARMCACL